MKRDGIFYGYICLIAIWVIYFFNVGTPLYGASAINANMVATRGFDSASVGIAVSLCTIMQGITGPIVGMLVRKKGVRLPLMFGSALLVVGSLLISFFTVNEVMFVIFYGLLIGTGMGFAGILTTQCVVNEWFVQKKGFAMALALSAGAVGGFVLPLICQEISGVHWNLGWVFMAISCCISLLLAVFVMKNRPSDIGEVADGRRWTEKHPQKAEEAEAGPIYAISKIFRTKAAYLILICNACRGALYYATIGHIVLYLISTGLENKTAVAVISVMSLSSLLGRFISGILTGKVLQAKYSSWIANIFCTVGILLLVFPKSLLLVNAGGAFMGLGIGVGYIAQPLIISDCFGKENFSAVSGWMSTINYVMNAVGPLTAGLIAKQTGSYVLTFLVFGAICLVGGFSAILIRKPDPAQLQ